VDVALALFAIVFVNCVVQSQYYVEQPTHIYVVDKGGADDFEPETADSDGSHETSSLQNNQFMSRRGIVSKKEESEEEEVASQESVEENHQRAKGRPRPIKLPSNFDEVVRRKLQLAKRQRRPLHGDPSPIHHDDDEDNRKPESRLLWPFSIEISKGKEGWGPQQYGSYTAWAADGWGEKGGEGAPNTGWGSYNSHPYNNGWEEESEEKKGLSDKEILKSKHYKKYQKKKKKIMKKLKKKLKFKRLIQKILQKHISYLDKIAPY